MLRCVSGLRIIGWGTALPDRVVTNHDLAETLDTSDEWGLHPETNDRLSFEDLQKVKAEAQKIVDVLSRKADALST